MSHKNFEEIPLGHFAELKHIITEDDVRKFVDLTGDDNPLHVNKAFSKKTIYQDTVAHGMLGASFLSTLIGKYIPGDGALWVSQNFNFLLPVRIGDELTLFAKVIEKHDSQHILVLETKITNQHKQIVTDGIGKVKLLKMVENEEENIPPIDKKVVIITGASRGIGASTAQYLANQGYSVVINYSKDKHGAESVFSTICSNGGSAMTYQADVRDSSAVNNMVTEVIKRFGTVTSLVCGATSKIIATDFDALTWEDLMIHFDVQLRGTFNCVKSVLKEFLQKKIGSVVILGSIAADATPPLKWTGYSSAKAALQTFSKSLALEYGPVGIRFNVVSPGMTETGLISDIPEKARLMTKMQTPLKRLAKPKDIAHAIAFLLSPEASHITGETLRVYGGQLML